jgi:hydroxyacid-oxoacid transhydrogenase
MQYDTAFQMAASNIRFGTGTTAEVGMDLQQMQVKRVMLVIDPALVDLPMGTVVRESLQAAAIAYEQFSHVAVEPTAESFQAATAAAIEGGFDAFVAVGGGSMIDTAKAANLYATHPADFFDFVNAPIGRGLPIFERRRSGLGQRNPPAATSYQALADHSGRRRTHAAVSGFDDALVAIKQIQSALLPAP